MSPPRVRAPQLPDDPALWVNTGGAPVRLTPGTVTLLDFFTYGCINCQHVLPDLEHLVARYRGRPFRVVGVHSGKFDHEKGAESVGRAVERLDIRHPVVRDDDHVLRRAYAVRAWPTFVLIDGAGYAVTTLRGEGRRGELIAAIDALLDGAGVEAAAPGRDADDPSGDATPLRYPGKVLADAAGGRLFIADTGNRRIVVAPRDGGAHGGDYAYLGDDGTFAAPQGMALTADGETLYVADAGDHAIRRVDLRTGRVETIAGTGRQEVGPLRPAASARASDLNSPWDLCLSEDDGTLFVAMAGSHQIAALDLTRGTLRILAGSGREARADGVGTEAAFAQPTGIARAGATLYVADAEASAIRAVDARTGAARTVAGGDLFDFGFAGGTGTEARFQHPLGVTVGRDGQVYVADSYNHRVRRVDAATGAVDTAAGSGATAELYEPGGVSAAGDALYIADTNRHRVRRLDLATGRLEDVPLDGLCPPGLCPVPPNTFAETTTTA